MSRARRWRVSTVAGVAFGAGVPALLVGVFFLWPVVSMIALGFGVGAPAGIQTGGGWDVLASPRTWRILGLTVGMAAAATVLAVALGLPAAWVLSRLRFRGVGLLGVLITVPFVLPTVVVGLAFRILFAESGPLGRLGLDGTPAVVVLALAFFNVAVVARTVGVSLAGLDPRAEQAAAVLGARPARVFRTVTLPRILPSVLAAASVVFLFCATSFGVVLVLGGPGIATIETEIYTQAITLLDLPAASVLAIVQLVVVVALLAATDAARRRVERADARDVHPPRPARRRDLPLIGVVVATAALLAVPMLVLLLRSLRVPAAAGTGLGLGNYVALGGTGEGNALLVPVWAALGNSLLFALAGTAISLACGIGAALVVSRPWRSPSARRLADGFDGALMLPLGVSAVTVGLGMLIALDTPPFDLRTSPVLIPIAQALVALPLVVRTVLPALRSIDPRLRQSAAVLGASPWRALRDIDLRMLAGPAAAAFGFAFAVCLGEFGATGFLARPQAPTLPVVIYRLAASPGLENQGMAIAASAVLAAVTVMVMTGLDRLAARSGGARVGSFG